jgi:hypothetical protein
MTVGGSVRNAFGCNKGTNGCKKGEKVFELFSPY